MPESSTALLDPDNLIILLHVCRGENSSMERSFSVNHTILQNAGISFARDIFRTPNSFKSGIMYISSLTGLSGLHCRQIKAFSHSNNCTRVFHFAETIH